MVRFQSDQEPDSVFTLAHAFYDDIKEIGDVDTAFVNFTFPSGAMAHVEVGRYASFGHDVRIEVFGSKEKSLNFLQCLVKFVYMQVQESSVFLKNVFLLFLIL